jgi:competence protein ComEA
LVAAGGLSLEADRNWVTQTLNLAAKVKDGDKIYIPFVGGSGQSQEPTGSDPAGKKININKASLSELDTLSGVGPVTAQKIIDNRPYAAVADIITKKVVSQKVYDTIKEQISVY